MTSRTSGKAGTPRLAWHAAAVVAVAVTAGACRQDMHDAPRYEPLEASEVLARGTSAQMLAEGTVARGHLNDDELLATGKMGGQAVDQFPFAITRADIDRGEVQFNAFCSPCHGRTGEGNGMVVQRGFRQPPSFHIDRLRQAPAGEVFDRITNGFGVMPDYRSQIDVSDRWRIVAYFRALQASHQGSRADVPAAEMSRLENPEPAAAAAPAASEGTH